MENYLISVAIKKLIQGLVKGVVTFILSSKAVLVETKLGIHIDPTTFQASAAAMILGATEYLHDWAKLKFPNAKWL